MDPSGATSFTVSETGTPGAQAPVRADSESTRLTRSAPARKPSGVMHEDVLGIDDAQGQEARLDAIGALGAAFGANSSLGPALVRKASPRAERASASPSRARRRRRPRSRGYRGRA